MTLWRRLFSARPGDGLDTLQRRRARAVVLGAALFALVVLATSMPIGNLFSQREQLRSSSAELARLQSENSLLSHEARQLSERATVDALARSVYGLVPPGSKAYDILPASSESGSTSPGGNAVPLGGPPVVPGSKESQALLGVDPGDFQWLATGSAAALVTPSSARGYWSRVLYNLEFWR